MTEKQFAYKLFVCKLFTEWDMLMNTSLHNMMLITQNRFYREILGGALKKGLSPGQPKVLELLRHEKECTQTEISRALDLDKSTVTGILSRMESAGLIVVRSDAIDKRRRRISLSPEGLKASDDMEEVFSEVDAIAWGNIPEDKRREFIETLTQIYNNISKAKRYGQ